MAPRPERQPRRRTSLRTATLAATVALALSTATCSDDEDAAENPTSTTTPADSTTTTLSVEEEVEAAYLAYWDLSIRLAENPNPDDPEIAQRASGEAMGDLIDGLTTLRASNQRSEFGPQYEHDVVSINVTEAVARLEDCTVDDSRVVDAATGRPVVEGVGTQLLSVAMVRSSTGWLVDQIDQVESWEGAVDCV